MKVFYNLFINKDSFENPKEYFYHIEYAYQLNGASRECVIDYDDPIETPAGIKKLIKKYNPELSNQRISLVEIGNSMLRPLWYAVTSSNKSSNRKKIERITRLGDSVKFTEPTKRVITCRSESPQK